MPIVNWNELLYHFRAISAQVHLICSCCPNLSASSEAHKNVFSYTLIFWLGLAKVFNKTAGCESCMFSHADIEVLLCSKMLHSFFLSLYKLISFLITLSKNRCQSHVFLLSLVSVFQMEEIPEFNISWSSFVRLLHTVSATLNCYRYFGMRRSWVLFTWWTLLVPHWTLDSLVLQTLGSLLSLNPLHHRLCPQNTC